MTIHYILCCNCGCWSQIRFRISGNQVKLDHEQDQKSCRSIFLESWMRVGRKTNANIEISSCHYILFVITRKTNLKVYSLAVTPVQPRMQWAKSAACFKTLIQETSIKSSRTDRRRHQPKNRVRNGEILLKSLRNGVMRLMLRLNIFLICFWLPSSFKFSIDGIICNHRADMCYEN